MTTGTIASIWRFPVKSLQGESLDTVELGPLGIAGDRRWGFREVDSGSILSAKKPEVGEILLGWSAVTEGDDVRLDLAGESFLVSSDRVAIGARASELLGTEVRLDPATTDEESYDSWWPEVDGVDFVGDIPLPMAAATEKGTFVDLAALHVITSSSLRRLQQLAPDSVIEVSRFRPGFVIDLDANVDEFVENGWDGRRATVGRAELALGGPSPRCVMTTKPQLGLLRDPDVLTTLARENRHQTPFGGFACLGCYAEVASAGTIAIGDRFEIH